MARSTRIEAAVPTQVELLRAMARRVALRRASSIESPARSVRGTGTADITGAGAAAAGAGAAAGGGGGGAAGADRPAGVSSESTNSVVSPIAISSPLHKTWVLTS